MTHEINFFDFDKKFRTLVLVYLLEYYRKRFSRFVVTISTRAVAMVDFGIVTNLCHPYTVVHFSSPKGILLKLLKTLAIFGC